MTPINSEDFLTSDSNDQLSSGCIFGALSPAAIRFLVSEGNLWSFEANEELFNVGSKGDHFFIVLEGQIEFIKHHKGKAFPTRVIKFGEALGFTSMIALHDHTGVAVALEKSIVLEITSNLYADLHDHYPADFGIITLNLARDMARTIRNLNNAIVKKST